MKKIIFLLISLMWLGDTSAQIIEQDVSSVYVGGHFRRNRPTTITKLRNSGFTTVILFNVHVDTDGTLMTDGETICKDGVYVFGQTQPNYITDVQNLKKSPTSVRRIEICIGGWGNDSYDHIKDLINNEGTGEETILYRNFKALKEAIPEIDAVNNDQEQCYDVTTAKKFHKMMGDLGMTTTIAPYTNKTYWKDLATYLNGKHLLDRILIQCYDGGAGNNPSNWNLIDGIPVHGGRMYYQDTWDVEYHIDKFQDWYDNNGVTGGFVWVYNDESWDLTAWATGMNRVFKARQCSEDLIGAKVYSDSDYNGYCVSIPEGSYKAADMALWGIGKSEISSLQVTEGYSITVYTNSNCGGKGCTFTESQTYIGDSYNDRVNSIKVTNLNSGVENVNYETGDDAVYSLLGFKVGTPTKKGIYIVNNKKILLK